MVKQLLFLAIGFCVVTACGNSSSEQLPIDMVKNPASASASPEEVKLPVMTFDSVLQHFGTIVQGEKVRRTFRFTNTGEADLIITAAEGTCGCTIPDYPRKPIPPGGTGEIKVLFNSEGKDGRQHKKVFVIANTQPPKNTIAIRGDVVGPLEKP